MKRTLLAIFILFCFATISQAQGRFTFRLEAAPLFNINLPNASWKSVSLEAAKADKVLLGYRIAPSIDFQLSKSVFINSGLNFSLKGNIYSTEDGVKVSNRVHYLQLPINAGLRFPISSQIGLGLQAGPYFSVALAGAAEKLDLDGIKNSYEIFKKGVSELNLQEVSRYDLGVSAQFILYYSDLYGTIGADFGLWDNFKVNLSKDTPQQIMRNTAFFIGVGVAL
ncbi:MAG: outer membrane beta-barrel protein [Porphyromonas sp.]|nr:outer membrane beta-barrel protein [Porphyromonas sp.]